jgi:homoserine O-succinyltransferase
MVHLATSPDGFRHVLFQGHPEYDTISLLKEYKREVILFQQGQLEHYPPFPENYLGTFEKAILNEYRFLCERTRQQGIDLLEFPEILISHNIDITWHDTAVEVIGNWMGLIYQITHKDRHIPFMDGIDPNNPLDLDF